MEIKIVLRAIFRVQPWKSQKRIISRSLLTLSKATRLKASFSHGVKLILSLIVLQIKTPYKRNRRKSLLTMSP